MGFRIYINEHTCLGKVYGYAGDVPHLYSLEYLCSINAFDEWQINNDLWNNRDPGDMREYFNCIQWSEDIFLTPEQFMRFICLYISDGYAVWGPEHWSIPDCIDILREVMNDIECEPDKKITINWG